MPPAEGSSDQSIAERLHRRLERLEESRQRLPAERLAYRKAAALLAKFDPSTLAPAGEPADDRGAIYHLFHDCVALGRSGESAWTLKPEVRSSTLAGMSGPAEALAALEANPAAADSRLAPLLRSLLAGEPVALEERSQGELALVLRAARWLKLVPGVTGLPDEARIYQLLERKALLDPFQLLTAHGFFGREKDLARLRSHVGVLEPKQWLTWAKERLTGRLFKRDRQPPLLVYGPGGIGKSTLVAQFLKEHLELDADYRFPFAYLDFERPTVTALEPMTLLFESCRQLRIQYPGMASEFAELEAGFRDEATRQNEDERRLRELRELDDVGMVQSTQRLDRDMRLQEEQDSRQQAMAASARIRRERLQREQELLARLAGMLRRAGMRLGPELELVETHAGPGAKLVWTRGDGQSPQQLIAAVAEALEEQPPPEKIESRLWRELPQLDASEAAGWLIEACREAGGRWVWFLGGFAGSTLRDDTAKLIAEIANQLAAREEPDGDEAGGLHLALLGYGGSIPRPARKHHRILVDKDPKIAPFLLVLDSFERTQYRSYLHLNRLWRLLEQLQEAYPLVRAVVSGRAPVKGLKIAKQEAIPLELKNLEPGAAVQLLTEMSKAGDGTPKFDPGSAEGLVRAYGGNPLTLHLLARLGKETPLSDEELAEARTSGWLPWTSSFDEAIIQGMLYERILGQINDKEILPLVNPGLVLRRITPEVIQKVLADFCEIEVPTRERAEELFLKLELQVDLVERLEPEVLGHHPEVRQIMLQLLEKADKRSKGTMVRDIEQAAVDYYRDRPGPQARAEEIYHRLRLGTRPDDVRELWEPGIENYLSDDAVEEVPEGEARAFLASRLRGLAAVAEGGTGGDLEFTEESIARQAEDLLAEGLADKALELIGEQPSWSEASPLFVVKAEALADLGRLAEAKEVVAEGIVAVEGYRRLVPDSAPAQSALFRLLGLAGSFAKTEGDAEAARKHLEAAAALAKGLDQKVDLLQNLYSLWSSVRQDAGHQERAERLLDRLTAAFLAQSSEELAGYPTLVASIGGEAGAVRAEVLERSIGVLGAGKLTDALYAPGWGSGPTLGRELAGSLSDQARTDEEWWQWLVGYARESGFVLEGRESSAITELVDKMAGSGKLPGLLAQLARHSQDGSLLRLGIARLVAATPRAGETSEARDSALAFLAGETIAFEQADALWRQLRREDELSLARRVLGRLRTGEGLDKPPRKRQLREELCRQEALLTSKDLDLSASVRHDRALEILGEEFALDDPALDGDAETLGIAGGIHKRRWQALGQLEDLRRAAAFYRRGAGGELGDDAYAQINSAFLEDLLAEAGDEPGERRERARRLRQRILEELPVLPDSWWNVASRAEALLGLGRYEEAAKALDTTARPEPWQLQSTFRQFATLARLRAPEPRQASEMAGVFEALLGGSAAAIDSAWVGKLGLALAGRGFRTCFFQLGALARLAELDLLRHVAVLSCVSGGSILGACYWLALRRRMLSPVPLDRGGYIELVRELIEHLERVVGGLEAEETRPPDPDQTADLLEQNLLRPLMPGPGPLYLDDLAFTPRDHDAELAGSPRFLPGKHNWMRAHKVPELVLGATTVNTGRTWQFTTTWMGEPPWSAEPGSGGVPRLAWSWYDAATGWRMRLAEAVTASGLPPGQVPPVTIESGYEGLEVELLDGALSDPEATGALLALDCSVALVLDGAGRVALARHPDGTGEAAAYRSIDILLDRARRAVQPGLVARRRAGLLQGLAVVDMKAGLDAGTLRLPFSQDSYELRRSPLSPLGIRRDVQQALAALPADLGGFSREQARALMAAGYRLAASTIEKQLPRFRARQEPPAGGDWPFEVQLAEITSAAPESERREALLAALRSGGETAG